MICIIILETNLSCFRSPDSHDQQTTHSSRWRRACFIAKHALMITLKRSGGAGEKQRDAHNMASY